MSAAHFIYLFCSAGKYKWTQVMISLGTRTQRKYIALIWVDRFLGKGWDRSSALLKRLRWQLTKVSTLHCIDYFEAFLLLLDSFWVMALSNYLKLGFLRLTDFSSSSLCFSELLTLHLLCLLGYRSCHLYLMCLWILVCLVCLDCKTL